MRILHTADWHLGKSLEGYSRLEEQQQFLDDFVVIANEKEIDMVIIAGDVFDTGNPTPGAERLFYDTLKRLSDKGRRLILVIAGNHDNPNRLMAANALAREHGILLVGTPKTIVETGIYGNHSVIDSGKGFIEVEINDERAVILTVPYPSERRLNEVLYQSQDEDDKRRKTYGERIHDLFDGLSAHFRDDAIRLVVSHLFAFGSVEGGSERSIQLGGSYLVSADCFPASSQYIALGHVHKPQVVPGTKGKARYSGSPLAYHRKEANTPKKCFVVDVSANQEAIVEEVLLNVYKPIEIWKCNGIEEAILRCEENQHRNCYVYLDIICDRYIREDEIKQMKETKADIVEIMPILASQEKEIQEQMIRDLSFEEMFRAFYLKNKEVEPDEEIVSLLLSILEEDESDETKTAVYSGAA